ncbi:MAG: restriction endonuclease subunit S, partial [Patescibacteria group bacterium]|nr:restriction endonuclease subunit S [Patescibacteria group bacterium]
YYCDKSEGVPMIRTKNLSEDGLMLKDLKYITHNFHLQNKKSQLRHNDILVARHGQNGLSCIYERYEQAQALNVIIFHTNENVLDPKFAVYALGSPLLLNQIGISTAGTVQRVLNTKTFAKLVIPLPPLNEQKQIVSILSKYFSLIKNDETIVNLMLNKLSILKTTILKSAFEGKLVPQDPNDETASVLLERIKQEKEKLQESKKIINIKSSKSWRTKNAK